MHGQLTKSILRNIKSRASGRFDAEKIKPRSLGIGNNGQVIHYLGTLINNRIWCADCLDWLKTTIWADLIPDPATDKDRITTDNVSHIDKCAKCGRKLNGKG